VTDGSSTAAPPAVPATLDDLAALDARYVMGTYRRQDVAFVRGAGTSLFDTEGREYLDFVSGLAVTSLGHSHPAVADAVAAQAATLVHVSNLYLNALQPRLAAEIDRLVGAAAGGPGRVFLANSGAEANECAIKLARRYGQLNGGPGRYHVVSAYGSFHGRTLAALAATGQPAKQETFAPLPEGFRHVPYGDAAALAASLDERVCAVLLEPVQGEAGVVVPPAGYLEDVRRLCDEREVLLVVDEVQTGLGRTGRWFGFEHGGDVRPDVVTLAKALGNGMPIAACWARGEVAAAFRPGDHGSTFGGQPLAAAAALATLTTMRAEAVDRRAAEAGSRLAGALHGLPGVASVRGAGLLLAVELADGLEAGRVGAASLRAGLVVNAVTPTALRLAPSLLVSNGEIDRAVTILRTVLVDSLSELEP